MQNWDRPLLRRNTSTATIDRVFATRKVLEEILALRREIRDLHAENMEMLRFTGEVIRGNERAFIEFRDEQRELRADHERTPVRSSR